MQAIEILLVDDSPDDILLTREALDSSKLANNLHVTNDGVEGMKFLRKEEPYEGVPTPDVVLLDLNMPRKDGREVLAEMKADNKLKHIPVIVLTTSRADEDIITSYQHHANCYVAKPLDFESFEKIVHEIEAFWFTIVKLPAKDIE